MTAVGLQRALIGALVLTVLLAATGFYFASKFLSQEVRATDHAKSKALVAEENLTQLKRLEAALASKQDVTERARLIIAETKQYQYQDQVVQDINSFAARAGVSILGFTFNNPSPKAPAAPKAKPALPAVKGVQVLEATITLDAPVDYANFLRFLKAIEGNLTRMQITGVNMSPDSKNPAKISNPTIGLQVFVRS